MPFLRIWTLYSRGKKGKKTKITKFLGPKTNKKGNKNKKYKTFGGQSPQSKLKLNNNRMGHYTYAFSYLVSKSKDATIEYSFTSFQPKTKSALFS